MKLQENLTGFGHIHVFDFEIDPTVSHIFNVWGELTPCQDEDAAGGHASFRGR